MTPADRARVRELIGRAKNELIDALRAASNAERPSARLVLQIDRSAGRVETLQNSPALRPGSDR